MKTAEIEGQYKQVVGLLKEQRLKEALELLLALSQSCGNYPLQEEVLSIQTSYGYMLQYKQQGMVDPKRDELYNDLLAKTYCLADQVYLLLKEDNPGSLYFAYRKQERQQLRPTSLSQLLVVLESFPDCLALHEVLQDGERLMDDLQKHERALGAMFRITWTNSRWSNADKEVAYKFLSSELITANDLSLYVSAVTMSLLACFDEAKMLWLIDAFYHQNTQVKVRAQVGFVLVSHIQSERILLYPGIKTRISLIQDEQPSFAEDINAIYLQLLRSQDTERINKTMREEIVPTVMKNLQDRKQQQSWEEGEEMDMNPEWLFDLGPKLNNKMRKISELQLEGSDANMGMFSMLKQFPFFNRIENWFYPFEPMHSEVVKAMGTNMEKEKRMEKLLMLMGMLCDSDSYSTVFMLNQLNESQRAAILTQLKEENLKDISEDALEEKYASHVKSPLVICKNYVHNLYRFYKLFPQKSEFVDVFENNLNLEDNPVLSPLLNQPHLIRPVADLLFKTERFYFAELLYNRLVDWHAADNGVMQRLGYCLEHEGIDEDAIKYYTEANLIAPGNKWTLRHLASCYWNDYKLNEAMDCYRELLSMEPENLTYTYHLGRCWQEKGEYDEALQCFYKMDLAEENNVKAWRAIAWCSLKIGKIDRAKQYLDKIIALQPKANDWMNAGHVALCQGQLSQAIEYYRKGMQADKSPSEFRTRLLLDVEDLLPYGITKTDLLLVLDLL